ncbi:MAG: hypothetical protein ACK55E_00470 [Cyanobacteriota bacterium]|jgi:hypothetical protein
MLSLDTYVLLALLTPQIHSSAVVALVQAAQQLEPDAIRIGPL